MSNTNSQFEYIKKPEAIYDRSFEIIEQELVASGYVLPDAATWAVVQRVIHATADFDFAKNLRFHPEVVATLLEVFKEKRPIITDARMVQVGLNTKALQALNIETFCYITDPEAIKLAQTENITVSMAAIRLAAARHAEQYPIFAIGNAPTALFELLDLIEKKQVQPTAIVGMPVGFVSVVESKEALMQIDAPPWITAVGRKGGSSATVAALNALLLLAKEQVKL